ncbi:aminoglycoside phosphotransferase family protein [Alkaliphilus peptidifermentans]|uniref:Phosphotransferase enzyme family protein n=1 Tax=Alkaliphilus peptidifermentans DSM 18978 TaxID=1120976 RepID=A0A1G5H9H7_9FIRM|nr:aminoglycoside phosphotransferase family protein [Alkaliphilus peptidifermentans]SCY60374.1 Phosphotransferase enzyme family protein [Alkaliphilus peptidifermentans DSM 18978]
MISNDLFQRFIIYYFNIKIDMSNIGHKELERNNVYFIPNTDQVLKIYSDKRRWEAEVASLKFLKNKEVNIPKLIDYGIFEDSLCWIIMSKLEGITLSQIVNEITRSQHKKIVYDMGHVLSNFHQISKAHRFGEWDENMKNKRSWLTFEDFETEKNRRRGNELLSQNYPENNLFKLGYSKMVDLEDALSSVNMFSLCHNDFSDRNILVDRSGNDIKIVGIIDFELSYPSDPESDLTKMVLKNYFNKDINLFISGYRKNLDLSEDFENKHKYYLISLCLEICSWARNNAYDFYKQAVDVLEQLV